MRRIKTEEIHFANDAPIHLVYIFSYTSSKAAEDLYDLLRDKGILCDYSIDELEFEGQGILIYLKEADYSLFMTLDEALDWCKVLPYGKIIIEGKDYTPVAELYSAAYNAHDDYNYADETDRDKEDVTIMHRIDELLKKLQS